MFCKIRSAALAVAVVACGFVGTSSASAQDVTRVFTLTNQTMAGFQFFALIPQGEVPAGTLLKSISVDITLVASVNETYADDLTVYVDALPLSSAGLLQVGGFSNLGAVTRLGWANGASEVPGTTLIDTKDVSALNIDLSGVQTWVGNGYGANGTSGTFTGTVTIVHSAIPEPSSLGLLGVAGLSLVRRRR